MKDFQIPRNEIQIFRNEIKPNGTNSKSGGTKSKYIIYIFQRLREDSRIGQSEVTAKRGSVGRLDDKGRSLIASRAAAWRSRGS
jgi:hypothetical protein